MEERCGCFFDYAWEFDTFFGFWWFLRDVKPVNFWYCLMITDCWPFFSFFTFWFENFEVLRCRKCSHWGFWVFFSLNLKNFQINPEMKGKSKASQYPLIAKTCRFFEFSTKDFKISPMNWNVLWRNPLRISI